MFSQFLLKFSDLINAPYPYLCEGQNDQLLFLWHFVTFSSYKMLLLFEHCSAWINLFTPALSVVLLPLCVKYVVHVIMLTSILMRPSGAWLKVLETQIELSHDVHIREILCVCLPSQLKIAADFMMSKSAAITYLDKSHFNSSSFTAFYPKSYPFHEALQEFAIAYYSMMLAS